MKLQEEEERRSRVQTALPPAPAVRNGGLVINPLRFVPDAKGITSLTLSELKADLAAAENNDIDMMVVSLNVMRPFLPSP